MLGMVSSSSSSGFWPERTPTCFMMDLRNRWAISRAERRDISALIIVWTSWPVGTRIPALETISDADLEDAVGVLIEGNGDSGGFAHEISWLSPRWILAG